MKIGRNFVRAAMLSSISMGSFGVATSAMAQDETAAAEEEEVADDVIIVTATKREQTLQETPISVSVTSGETLEQAQIRDVLDLQTVAPSLRVSQLQNSSSSTFIIRGFGNGDNNFGIEPSVGVFIDGVFRSRSASALSDLSNVQRIEVLNGPQSTLFGKNASAGVISVVTRKPQFQFGGGIEASYGNFNNIQVKGDITGPITDGIAFSLDGSYNKRDGYGRIVNLNRDISDRNRWNARAQLLIEPSDSLSIRAQADYSKIDEICCVVSTQFAGPTAPAVFGVGGALSTDFFSYDTFLNRAPINEVDNYGGSIQADLDLGSLSLTSITAYRKLTNFVDQDVDFTSADIVNEIRDQRVSTFTQEFRLASDFDGPLNFLLGGFYFDEKVNQESELNLGAGTRPFFSLLAGGLTAFNGVETALGLPQNSIFSPGPLTDEVYSLDNNSWSIFGTVDLEPVDGLVFTAGFNYTDDRKDFALRGTAFDELANINLVDAFIVGGIAQALMVAPSAVTPAVIQGFATGAMTAPIFNQIATLAQDPMQNGLLALAPFQFQPPFLTIPNAVEDGKTNDTDFSYTLRASYAFSENINAYVSYATGFKASSINLSRDSRPAGSDFTPGPRRSTILAPSSAILNAGLAVPNLNSGTRLAGPEDAVVWEVGVKGKWDGLSVNLALFDQSLRGFQSFAFTGTGFNLANAGEQSVKGFELDTRIQPTDSLVFTFAMTYLDPFFDSFTGSAVGDLTGQTPGGIPAINISTSATHTYNIGDGGTKLVTRVDYSHEGKVNINNGLPTFGRNPIFRREVNLVNASTTLALSNGLELGVYARNLLNDQYILTVFDGVAQAGTVSGYPSPPRTYGAVVRFKF